jgi:hypothetical protein
LVRGSITGADASGMTRAPKSRQGMHWTVNPAPAESALILFSDFPLQISRHACTAHAMPWRNPGESRTIVGERRGTKPWSWSFSQSAL